MIKTFWECPKKLSHNGITDKKGCWEYLIKYYEWLNNAE